MKRTTVLWVLLNSVFLITFNFLFFILSDIASIKSSVWTSYGFIHFAYFALLLTPLLVRKSKAAADYRRPLFLITGLYFILSLAVGLTFILLAPATSKLAIIIYTIITALFLIWLIIHLLANEHTADNVTGKEKAKQQTRNQ